MFSLLEYIKYLFRCFRLHGIHSPFVFDFNEEVVKDVYKYYCFDEIESIRAKLELTEKKIDVLDLGAGSRVSNHTQRKISNIAKTALKPTKQAQLLFKLAKYFQPDTILEIGTSLGISTSYLSKSCPDAKVISLEGSPQILKVAKINFEKLDIANITTELGNFDDTLIHSVKKLKKLDLVYFDGNHKERPTLNYFEACLPYSNESSIFIFDDIYWSKGMKRAWNKIKSHPEVTVSIDLFHFGIVFFKKDQEKQHFTIYH